jgi:hypothetical protein
MACRDRILTPWQSYQIMCKLMVPQRKYACQHIFDELYTLYHGMTVEAAESRREIRPTWLAARSTIRVTIARPMGRGHRTSEANGTVPVRALDQPHAELEIVSNSPGSMWLYHIIAKEEISGCRDGEIAGSMEISRFG